MRIAIAGTDHIGLSSALLLAQRHMVVAPHIDPVRVEAFTRRKSTLGGMEIQVVSARPGLDFRATLIPAAAFSGADYVVIATPTNDHATTDTRSVEAVIANVLAIASDATMIIKSTVPVGHTERVRAMFGSSSLPGFCAKAVRCATPCLPVGSSLGERSERAAVLAERLRAGALKADVPVLLTGSTEAEAIKRFASTCLAMRGLFQRARP